MTQPSPARSGARPWLRSRWLRNGLLLPLWFLNGWLLLTLFLGAKVGGIPGILVAIPIAITIRVIAQDWMEEQDLPPGPDSPARGQLPTDLLQVPPA